MAVRLAYATDRPVIKMACKSATTCYEGQLLKNDSGAAPCATGAQTDASILGLCIETTTSGGTAKIVPVSGVVLELDVDTSGTKTTFAAADLGTAYDMSVSTNDQMIDPDDTTGGWLYLVGYDNDRAVAYALVSDVDLLF